MDNSGTYKKHYSATNRNKVMYTKLLILFVMLMFNGCIHKGNSDNKSRSIKKVPPKVILEKEKFNDFYNRFYSDSNFQISRILFPLPGANSDVIYGDAVVKDQVNDTFLIKNNKYYWQKKGWIPLKTLHGHNKEFIKTIEKDNDIIREQIRSRDTDWVITNEFSLIGTKWMLTYHSNEWY